MTLNLTQRRGKEKDTFWIIYVERTIAADRGRLPGFPRFYGIGGGPGG